MQNYKWMKQKSLLVRIIEFRFHPDRGFKLWWDMTVILLSIYNAFVIPLQFSKPELLTHPMVNIIDHVIDAIFYSDIILNFKTVYIDPKNEEFVSDLKKIAINYLQGRLLIDLLASLPFEVFFSIAEVKMNSHTTNLLTLLKLTRLLRLGRMISYF